jgi:hypothetical protein
VGYGGMKKKNSTNGDTAKTTISAMPPKKAAIKTAGINAPAAGLSL